MGKLNIHNDMTGETYHFYDEEHVEEAKKEAYEAGMNAAWSIAKELYCMGNEIFENYVDYQGMELKEYLEEKKKIHVGDVVRHKDNDDSAVLVTSTFNNNLVGIIIKYGDHVKGTPLFSPHIEDFEKTGKRFDLNEVFKLAGDSDGCE